MNYAAIIVLYNPQNYENVINNNLILYSSVFKNIYIIDNSQNNNSKIIQGLNNCIYIPLYENKGIATALNIGCQSALNDGFEWVLTMDQDSVWDKETLIKYIEFTSSILNKYNDVKSVAALPNINHSLVHDILSIFKSQKKSDYVFCDRCICSGNFIELNTWKSLNGFYENLFIDEVDFDYCYRLRVNGYRIIQTYNYIFNHTIGNGKKAIIPGTFKHGMFRFYYMIRNRFYIIKKYPEFAKKFHYKIYMIILYLQKCLLDKNRKENKKIYIKAKEDSKALVSECI